MARFFILFNSNCAFKTSGFRFQLENNGKYSSVNEMMKCNDESHENLFFLLILQFQFQLIVECCNFLKDKFYK